MEVELSPTSSALAGFASWLPDHAGLVGAIDTGSWFNQYEEVLAQRLHSLSLKLAAAAAQPLCLRSFTTSIPCASMLSALPAASLTHLKLCYEYNPLEVLHRALTSAIARLTNLRKLQLTCVSFDSEAVTGACLLEYLSCHTSLHCTSMAAPGPASAAFPHSYSTSAWMPVRLHQKMMCSWTSAISPASRTCWSMQGALQLLQHCLPASPA